MSMPLTPKLIAVLVSAGVSSAVFAEDTSRDAQTNQITTFSAALKQAKQNDPELKYSFHTLQAEQEIDDIAFANLLPSVSLQSSYRYQKVDDYYTEYKEQSEPEDSQIARNPARYDEDQSDYSYQVKLQQSLINIGAWQAYDSAKEAVRKSQFTYSRAEQELIYRLSSAYLKALLAAQQLYINQDKLESLQLKLDQTQRMNELGVGDRLNVLRATSSRDVARSDLLQSKSELKDAQTQLENITGSSVDIPSAWVTYGYKVLPNLGNGSEDEWINSIQSNTTLLAEMANVRSKELEADAQKSQHLPTLNFSLSYVDRHNDDIYSDSSNYIASLDLTIPIYSGGKTSAQSRRSEANYNAAQARYEKLLSDKKQAVKLAYSQLSSYRERLLALEESRTSSKTFLEAAERQADLSLGSQVDVLEARTELYNVRLQFAKTLSDYLLSDLNLRLETGQLNDSTLAQYDNLFASNAK
ncbi:TolC family protein [Marinomonas gallaica]|nr:TolC family protein [Marinomonas gallaica]